MLRYTFLREVENCPEEEKNEMVEIYTEKYGFSRADAQSMVDITFKYKQFFVQHMMVEELGLMYGYDEPTPMKRGTGSRNLYWSCLIWNVCVSALRRFLKSPGQTSVGAWFL